MTCCDSLAGHSEEAFALSQQNCAGKKATRRSFDVSFCNIHASECALSSENAHGKWEKEGGWVGMVEVCVWGEGHGGGGKELIKIMKVIVKYTVIHFYIQLSS